LSGEALKRKHDKNADVAPNGIDWSKSIVVDFHERFNLKGVMLDRDLLKSFESMEEVEQALREYLARKARRKRTA
jgi:hypothetical protein